MKHFKKLGSLETLKIRGGAAGVVFIAVGTSALILVAYKLLTENLLKPQNSNPDSKETINAGYYALPAYIPFNIR